MTGLRVAEMVDAGGFVEILEGNRTLLREREERKVFGCGLVSRARAKRDVVVWSGLVWFPRSVGNPRGQTSERAGEVAAGRVERVRACVRALRCGRAPSTQPKLQ